MRPQSPSSCFCDYEKLSADDKRWFSEAFRRMAAAERGPIPRRQDRAEFDPLGAFIKDIDKVPSADIPPTPDLYDAYRDYCDREGLRPVARSSVLGAAHGLARPSDGVAQALGRFTADDLGGIPAPHLRKQAFEVSGETFLERLDKRTRGFGVDGVKGHGHVDERLIQQGVGDARRQRVEAFLVFAHRNFNVLSCTAWRMLGAGSRVAAASRQSASHKLRGFATGARLEAREGGKLAAYLFQRFALPAFRALRRDLPLASAATLFAVGFPCGVLALALAVTP